LPNRFVLVLASFSITVAAAACSEDFSGGAACPGLCPESGFEIVNDTLEAIVALDSTIRGYPPPGEESRLVLLQRFSGSDSAITAGVVRYDVIEKTIIVGNDTLPITKVDSAFLRLTVIRDTLDTLSRRDASKPVPVTIEVYDVDTTASDFDTAAVRQRFRPGTLLGTQTVRRDSITDSLFVRLDTAAVRARVQGGRMRVGLRIRSDSSVQLPLGTSESFSPVQLKFWARAANDSTAARTINPVSESSGSEGELESLADYMIVLRGTPEPPPQILAVGGLPAQRAYIRLSLPSRFVDSVTVLRAALVLTQAPVRGGTDDTVRTGVQASVSLARTPLDISRAALFVSGLFQQARAPRDSGLVRFELAGLVLPQTFQTTIQFWRGHPEDELPRAVVLRSSREGQFPSEFHFYSNEAAPNLRPRIEISYVSRVDFSLP
jgi:hypothetical protein